MILYVVEFPEGFPEGDLSSPKKGPNPGFGAVTRGLSPTYDDMRDIFNVHTPYKRIHFRRSKREIYYHNCKSNGKKCDVTFVHTFYKKTKEASQIKKSGTQKRQDLHTTWWDAHQRQILSAWYVETCFKIAWLSLPILKTLTQSLAPTPALSAVKQ